jgi:hypothetical protein
VQQAPHLFDKECDTSDRCQNYDNPDRPASLDTLHYLVWTFPQVSIAGQRARTRGSPSKDCIKELPIGRFVTHDHMISAFERNKFCPRNPRSKFLTQIEWNAHVATSVQDKCWHVYGLQDASNIKVSIHT